MRLPLEGGAESLLTGPYTSHLSSSVMSEVWTDLKDPEISFTMMSIAMPAVGEP